jgi:hypothetical protein
MKTQYKALCCAIALCVSGSSLACSSTWNGYNNAAGKTVGWIGSSSGKLINGVANGYGTILHHTFYTTHHLFDGGCHETCSK